MVVIKGMPGVESTGFPPVCSTLPAEIASVSTTKFEFTSISSAESNTTVNETITTLHVPTIVNIGSGAVAPIAFA
jgi:hypothetical protein